MKYTFQSCKHHEHIMNTCSLITLSTAPKLSKQNIDYDKIGNKKQKIYNICYGLKIK